MVIAFWKTAAFRQYAVVAIVNLSIINVSLGIQWTSPILVKLRDVNNTVLNRPITESEGSWLAAIGFISGLVANLPAAYLINKIGRKYCLLLSAVPRVICYLCLIFASDVWMMLVGRFILGWSDAMVYTVSPVYASEVASKEIRGGLGTIIQMLSSLGTVIILCIGPFLDYVALNKMALYLTIASVVPQLILYDSPYFLYNKGKTAESYKVLTFLRGSTTLASEEIKEYEVTKNSHDEKVTVKEIFQSRPVMKALVIALFIGLGTTMTGFCVLSFYLQTILESTQSTVSSNIASLIIGIIQMFGSFCTTLFIDKFGRRPIATITLVGFSFGMVGLGTFFRLFESNHVMDGALNYLPLISIIVAVYCFSSGIGSVQWPLTAELFDGRFRAIGVATYLTSSVLSVFLLTLNFSKITNSIGASTTYWMFSVFSILYCLFIYLFVPETKGKSFAEIQEVLGDKKFGQNVNDSTKV